MAGGWGPSACQGCLPVLSQAEARLLRLRTWATLGDSAQIRVWRCKSQMVLLLISTWPGLPCGCPEESSLMGIVFAHGSSSAGRRPPCQSEGGKLDTRRWPQSHFVASHGHLPKAAFGPDGVAQWFGCHPAKLKVIGWFQVRGHAWVASPVPGQGTYRRQLTDVSLSCRCFSSSFSSSPLSKNK